MLCQVTLIRDMGEKNSKLNEMFQKRVRILRPAKRKMKYLVKTFLGVVFPRSKINEVSSKTGFSPGDLVKVKSKAEIRKMLDNHEKYKGCLFIDEMFEYCDKHFRILKDVHCFFDEAKQKMCECENIVLLENVLCSGRQRLYNVSCDRSCFFFWHTGWLEK